MTRLSHRRISIAASTNCYPRNALVFNLGKIVSAGGCIGQYIRGRQPSVRWHRALEDQRAGGQKPRIAIGKEDLKLATVSLPFEKRGMS
jgi:hypothetical protein